MDFSNASDGHFGIMTEPTLPELTAVSYCSWVLLSERRTTWAEHVFSSLNSEGEDRIGMQFARHTNEIDRFGIRINGQLRLLDHRVGGNTNFYDGKWNSFCVEWQTSGWFRVLHDSNLFFVGESLAPGETIAAGGYIAIGNRILNETSFYTRCSFGGSIGAVNIWSGIFNGPVDDLFKGFCWAVGDLFRLEWNELTTTQGYEFATQDEEFCQYGKSACLIAPAGVLNAKHVND